MHHSSPTAHAARSAAARRIRFARPYVRAVCPRCRVPLRLDPESNVLLEHTCSANDGQSKLTILTA